jgi:hypothetical protein
MLSWKKINEESGVYAYHLYGLDLVASCEMSDNYPGFEGYYNRCNHPLMAKVTLEGLKHY